MRRFKTDILQPSQGEKETILVILLILSVIIPNLLMAMQPGIPFCIRALNVLLPLGVYCMAISFIANPGWSVIALFPAMFLSAFQLVLFYLNGELVISVDMWLNLPSTNTSEVSELLHSLVKAMVLVTAVYVPLILTGIHAIVHKWKLPAKRLGRLRTISAACLLSGSIAVIVARFRNDHITDNVFPVNAIANLFKAFGMEGHIANYKQTSADFSFKAKCTNDDAFRELHLLVIGETSRADHWELLGYSRPTTSALSGLDGLTAFPNVLSQSNTTHKSVPLMLSHIDATHYGDSIYRVKSLITAFREAGYRTAFFSSQQRNHSYIDFFGEEADTCVFISDNDKRKTSDNSLIGLMEEELAKGYRKQLIVFHTYGSHFNYRERYSTNEGLFLPDNFKSASPRWRKELINAYDNTIVATSRLIGTMIKMADAQDCCSTLLYTSDHGEDIFDDGSKRFLHASAVPSYYQLHVPMLLWTSREFREMFPDKSSAIIKNKNRFISSSSACFHTMLDCANIQTPFLRTENAISSVTYLPPRALFINDKNEAVALESTGMDSTDLRMAKRIIKP